MDDITPFYTAKHMELIDERLNGLFARSEACGKLDDELLNVLQHLREKTAPEVKYELERLYGLFNDILFEKSYIAYCTGYEDSTRHDKSQSV